MPFAFDLLPSVALLLLPASALAKELVDRSVARILPPRRLPRLDLRDGIPAELRTIVVIPTLLLTPESVRGQVEALEVLALANSDPHLHFALLSDFADAPAAEMPNDMELLTIARAGIEQLNAEAGGDRFFLLHRRRVWNERQRCFMGWERKRGKLEEFNQLLAGSDATTFATCVGDLGILPHIRYAITLDADTQLPRDAGRALIGSLAHPLNQARSIRRLGRSLRAMASSSHASASTCRARCAAASRGSFPAMSASIRTHRGLRRLHGSVRRRVMPARASTIRPRCAKRWPIASPRTPC